MSRNNGSVHSVDMTQVIPKLQHKQNHPEAAEEMWLWRLNPRVWVLVVLAWVLASQ